MFNEVHPDLRSKHDGCSDYSHGRLRSALPDTKLQPASPVSPFELRQRQTQYQKPEGKKIYWAGFGRHSSAVSKGLEGGSRRRGTQLDILVE